VRVFYFNITQYGNLACFFTFAPFQPLDTGKGYKIFIPENNQNRCIEKFPVKGPCNFCKLGTGRQKIILSLFQGNTKNKDTDSIKTILLYRMYRKHPAFVVLKAGSFLYYYFQKLCHRPYQEYRHHP